MSSPVETYVAELAATLHGPARAKARLVAELRDGLTDTLAAHTAEGVPYEEAARAAVREFGTVGEIAPSCQRELTVAQARHTARTVILTAPLLVACWFLAGVADPAPLWQLPVSAGQLTLQLAGVATVTALLAALCAAVAPAALTGPLARRLRAPGRFPLAVAWAGTTATVAMASATLALVTAAVLAADWPLLGCAGALAAAAHASTAASARACRRCARLPTDLAPAGRTA
ncbi:permease prefix domain 1-containing protein [Streptomyces sp. NPDC060194]|uniref:permease prefix domain 1-containing protein n=1 Tax=Streptomyces sp. NPDC060194 TaxID=3347069 RepID=UPI00365DEDF1